MSLRARLCLVVASTAIALASATVSGDVRTETVMPQQTDPTIDAWLAAHFVALDPDTTHAGRLFIFLHGAGGTGTGATELCRIAAAAGFHVIAITYANDWVPFQFCNGADSDCYENLRREIIDGIDRSPHIAVSPANSLENRIAKLLLYLDAQHPGEAWAQFLDSAAPRWSRAIVYGHSQGGANAAMIARHHVVARLVMSAPAADFVGGAPASWWSSHLTPAAACFGFVHQQDQPAAKQAAWAALGMNVYGPLTDVATANPPFDGTHQLSSSIPPAVANQFHNSTSMDSVTPRNADGTPTYRPVWEYLIGAAGPAGDLNCDGSANVIDIPAFITALVEPANFGACDIRRADLNHDARIDGRDIAGFLVEIIP